MQYQHKRSSVWHCTVKRVDNGKNDSTEFNDAMQEE